MCLFSSAMCVGGAVGAVKPTPSHRLDLGTLPSVSAWESAAAISITYWGGESFILPGSNPESIDERVGGGGGGQCEVMELGHLAVREVFPRGCGIGCHSHEGGGEGHAQELNLGSPRA